ncbi:MAG: hypothetical protein L6Q26_03775 [Anaerolineales bacterium]|nr:hypothetical protein [Anaerolineales bacterium]NUQ85804.1 hypothetical protein [Anaerolineales bacterium]
MQPKPAKVKNRSFWVIILALSVIVVLSCNLISSVEEDQPDPSIVETDIALRVMSTSLANEGLTLQAAPSQMTAPPTQMNEPPPQDIQPTPIQSQTDAPPPASLVLDIQTSVNVFYCYQPPYELTITVKVSDINRGMAVYYHIKDKTSGVVSDGQVIDLHRKSGDTRAATIIGGGSMDQNLQFPPLMGESYFVYQIISDDGSYRSQAYTNVTFFPCAQ